MPAPTIEAVGDTARQTILPFQPHPVRTRVAHLRRGGERITAIFRRWKPGDSGPQGRCRLCPACTAYADGCLLLIAAHIPRESAPLFSLTGVDGREQGPAVLGVVNDGRLRRAAVLPEESA